MTLIIESIKPCRNAKKAHIMRLRMM